jgi:hypothetical protein
MKSENSGMHPARGEEVGELTTSAQVAQFTAARRQLESGLTGLFTDLLIAPVIVLARRTWRPGAGGQDARTAGRGEPPNLNRLAG